MNKQTLKVLITDMSEDFEEKIFESEMKKAVETDDDDAEEEEEEEKTDFVQWLKEGCDTYFPEREIKLVKKIPEGIYDIKYHPQKGYYFKKKQISLDELFILPSNEQTKILDDIKVFWERKEYFKKYNFTYKRGILLYGPAGGGKSSTINLLASEIVNKYKGIVFYLNNTNDLSRFQDALPMLKQIEPDKQILCVLEDLETFVSYKEGETELLNLLDGINQMDNVVYLGTTNYPEELKDRILNRPSRFDRRYEIKMPNAKVREAYFKLKLKDDDLKDLDLDLWVKKTKGYSLAHLGEVVKSVFGLGNSFEETLLLLENMKEKLSSFDFNKNKNKSVGFNVEDSENYD